MDFEVLYSTAADTVEAGDAIARQGEDRVLMVEFVLDNGDSIVIQGEVDGEREDWEFSPSDEVDILGN